MVYDYVEFDWYCFIAISLGVISIEVRKCRAELTSCPHYVKYFRIYLSELDFNQKNATALNQDNFSTMRIVRCHM